MSEGEKDAIENIDNSYDWNTGWVECEATTWNIIKNLIDKLQKENEALKEENFDQVYMKAIADYKEKIRNKIKEYEENIEIFKNLHKADGIGITECKILGLEEILEEE